MDKLDTLRELYTQMLKVYPDGLSSTSTKKFDDIKSFFATWLKIEVLDIYATGAGTRPGNLEVRLSQGLQATKHTKLGLGFLLDENNNKENRKKLTNSTLVTIRKFLGGGKANYDAILILIQSGSTLHVCELAFRKKERYVEQLLREFNLGGIQIEERNTLELNDGLFDEQAKYDPISDPNEIEQEDDVEIEKTDVNVQLMVQPFNPSFINIDNKLLTVDLFIKRLSQSIPEIDLYPDFQRKDNLWDNTKQSRLIESILIRFPLPAFYFDGSNKNKWLVVDGLQRLSSIRNFAVLKTLKLTNLEFLVQLNGKGFEDLDRDLQRIIEETQVIAYIINPGTPDDVKFNIFRRINTGGLILQSQEIRHALYQGVPAKYVEELASVTEFKNLGIKSERMLDRDFVNRFLSFYVFGYENYTPDLETYMSRAMAHLYKMSTDERDICKNDFKESMKLNLKLFGELAFRKPSNNDRKNPINKALFDVFSVSFAKLNSTQRRLIEANHTYIREHLNSLIQNDTQFLSSITSSTSDKNRVNYRFSKINQLINNITKQ